MNCYEVMNVIKRYTSGEITQNEANLKLVSAGVKGIDIEPMNDFLENSDVQISADLTNVNGYVKIDTGTGTMDTVRVCDNKLVNCDLGNMEGLAIAGKFRFNVKGDKITEFVGMRK